jgi:hypothetical protein
MRDLLNQELKIGDIIAVVSNWGTESAIVIGETKAGNIKYTQPTPDADFYDDGDSVCDKCGPQGCDGHYNGKFEYSKGTVSRTKVIKITIEQHKNLLVEEEYEDEEGGDEEYENLIKERIIEMYKENNPD